MKHVLKFTVFLLITIISLLIGSIIFMWSFKPDDVGIFGRWLDSKINWTSWFNGWS